MIAGLAIVTITALYTTTTLIMWKQRSNLQTKLTDSEYTATIYKGFNKRDSEEKRELRKELSDEKLKSSELQRISKHQAKELKNYKSTMQEIADHKGIIYRTKPYGFAVMASDTIFMTPQELAQQALERGGKVT